MDLIHADTSVLADQIECSSLTADTESQLEELPRALVER